MHNPNKSITATSKGIIISFSDTNKRYFVTYDEIEDTKEKINVVRDVVKDIQLNEKQDKLLKTVVYGLTSFSVEEKSKLTQEEKTKILALSIRANICINRIKQRKVNELVNDFILTKFNHSKTAKVFTQINGCDDKVKCKFTLRELGVSKQLLVHELIVAKVLPSDFYNL